MANYFRLRIIKPIVFPGETEERKPGELVDVGGQIIPQVVRDGFAVIDSCVTTSYQTAVNEVPERRDV